MAEKRMISKRVTDTDIFLDMPLSAQALYFHLNLEADDDGFLGNTKMIKRKIGASDDDLKLLLAKQLLIPFENGIVVIKDWRIHNVIRKDLYKRTEYTTELAQLELTESKKYQLRNELVTGAVQDRTLDKNRLDKTRLDKDNTLSGKPDSASPKFDYKLVIDYLNDKAGTAYRANGKKTQQLINARVADGFVIDDFKRVIDTKVAEWANGDMAKFLRPETLFGTKFESYLNQQVIRSKGQADDGLDLPF
jgi:uncharacterized phage protein (TIGR02220 family)